MAFKKSLYLTFIFAVWFLGATGCLFAQEPVVGPTPQLVSGGVVEKDTAKVEPVKRIKLQSPIFRDTLPLSRMSAISLGVPGFSQLYNRDYWKIPVLYGTVGTLTYMTIDANKKYQRNKRQYDFLLGEYYALSEGDRPSFLEGQIEPVQSRMNRYNTQRTLYFAGAAATYLYFIADGVLNYPHPTTPVKKATTLAMIFPGAGQIYNKSYWKVPIVIGGFATLGYLIDWNQRGYDRSRTALKLWPNDEFGGMIDKKRLQNSRDQFRRNRDLCIILTGAAYLLSVIEAHVDAHLKDFDVSDDLAMRIEPTLIDMSGLLAHKGSSGYYPGVGLSMKINF